MKRLAILFVLCLSSACSKDAPQNPDGLITDAGRGHVLWEAYDNELQGDTKFKGKWLSIEGSVEKISKDSEGRYVAGMAVISPAGLTAREYAQLTAQERKWYNDGYPPNVLCRITPASQAAFATLDSKKSVKIVGRCVGRKNDSAVWKGYVVVLEHCRLAD